MAIKFSACMQTYTIAVCGQGRLQHFATYQDKESTLPTAFLEYLFFAQGPGQRQVFGLTSD
jgi:hypothetical protein